MQKSLLKVILYYCSLLSLLNINSALAWNSTGHKIIASISYQNLNYNTRKQIDNLTKYLDHYQSGYQRFVYLSSWADHAGAAKYPKTLSWHFIDNPFVDSDFHGKKPTLNQANVISAIKKEEKILKSKTATPKQKATALAFLIHLVGDIHQPLHCINHFSKKFPHGDQGGNLVVIDATTQMNLHAYWDNGLGLFTKLKDQKTQTITKIATQFSTTYSENYFQGTDENLDIKTWATESYNLAVNFAYKVDTIPKQNYQTEGQEIVKTRLVLAGLRLAKILNAID
jgi:hypothetical protein